MDSINYTELLIAGQLRQGSEEAFRYLYRHHYAAMCMVAWDYVGSRTIAESIVSDVMFRLWENHENIQIHTSIRAYLITATRHQCLDFLKSKVNRREVLVGHINNDDNDHHDIFSGLTADDCPLGQLIEKELEDKIQDAIDSLPPATRNVFLKSRIGGRKYEEISREDGISVNTVKYHIKQALKLIDKYIKPYIHLLIFFSAISYYISYPLGSLLSSL
ncbi:RNA polymerase sigma-70 factor [uncultured Muribaculum sp.]|uniref:RNA polymerase sigma-70 factor n=1 Tax=uncultured Muribaculum sp. TaxID=1918613 RepID=UPI0025E9CD8B|nr:RNA polymerase sigma-70 factor [uncultured Muribaculum sp.]